MPLRGNALLTRVRAHRSMTTLYRSSDRLPPAAEATRRPAPLSPVAHPGKPLVMAKLVPPGITLPVGQVISAESVRPTVLPQGVDQQPLSPPAFSPQEQSTSPEQQIGPPARREVQSDQSGPQETRARSLPSIQASPAVVPEPRTPSQPRPSAQTSSDVSSKPAPPPVQRETAQPAPSQAAAPSPATGGDDFSWISDGEWNRLKNFMEGHQALLAEQNSGPEAIQRAEEEQTERTLKVNMDEEAARRQTLARQGKLPKATVNYVSPEMAGSPTPVSQLQKQPDPPKLADPGEKTPAEESTQAQATAPPAPDMNPAKPETVQRTPRQQPGADPSQPPPRIPAAAPPTPEIVESPEPLITAQPAPVPHQPESGEPATVLPSFSDASLTGDAPPHPIQSKQAPDSHAPSIPTAKSDAMPPPVTVETPDAGRSARSTTTPPIQAERAGSPEVAPSTPATAEAVAKPATSAGPSQTEAAQSQPDILPGPDVPADTGPQAGPASLQLEPETAPAHSPQSEPTLSPPAEAKAEEPGGIRRFLDAARSFLGRDEDSAGEVSSEMVSPVEPAPSPAAPTPAAVQREVPESPPTPTVDESAGDISRTEPAGQQQQPTEAAPIQESATDKPADASAVLAPDLPSTSEVIPAGSPETLPSQLTKSTPDPASPPAQQQPGPTRPVVETSPPPATPQLARQEDPRMEDLIADSPAVAADPVPQPKPATRSPSHQPVVARKPAEPAPAPKPAPETTSEITSDLTSPTAIDPGDAETLIQPFSLEEIWPVQEVKQPERTSPPSQTAMPEGGPIQRKPAGLDEIGEDIHSRIKDLAPVEPTDSSIELITPRRPRPVQAPRPETGQADVKRAIEPATAEQQAPPTEAVPPLDKALAIEPATDVDSISQLEMGGPAEMAAPAALELPKETPIRSQRPPEPALPSSVEPPATPPLPSPAESLQVPSTGQAPPSVQKHPDHSGAAPAAAPPPPAPPVTSGSESEPYMVATEIGALPSDLWEMLGESPPSRPDSEQPTTPPTRSTEVVQRREAVPPAPVSQPSEPQRLITEEFHSPDIQRVESPRAGSGQADQRRDEAAEEDEGGEEEGGEINVEELAKQVYPELKRRLQVDWERGRGRFH